MELIDAIKIIAQKNKTMGNSIQTEEAAKTALVMPFIQGLGYDVFNPAEVVPEFVADIADRKGEKIDYAIFKDGVPIMLIECKWTGYQLTQDNRTQLARYFMVVPARIGILTNGMDYEFYSDLDDVKTLDNKPFLKFSINDINDTAIKELKKFCKNVFDIDEIIPAAEELKYTNEMKKYLMDSLNEPDADFIRFMTKKVYDGKLTSTLTEKFTAITKKAFGQFISDRISDRLASALKEEKASQPSSPQDSGSADASPASAVDAEKIATTSAEMEGFNIVRAILCKIIPVEMIAIRDTINYCNVLYNDNRNTPICKFYFNSKNMRLGLLDADKKENRIGIEKIEDIFKYSDEITQTVQRYLAPKEKALEAQP